MGAQVGADAGECSRVSGSGITDLKHLAACIDITQLMGIDGVTVEQPLVPQLSVVGRLAGEVDIISGLAVVFLGLNVDMLACRCRGWCVGADIHLHIALVGALFVLGLAAIATLVGLTWWIEDQASAIGGGVAIGLAIDTSPDHVRCGITAHFAVDLVGLILLEGHRRGQVEDLSG